MYHVDNPCPTSNNLEGILGISPLGSYTGKSANAA
jgi:hypothetical protein